jgi:tRNA threonylcarbamoyladenosine biosynthesis protein TsaE
MNKKNILNKSIITDNPKRTQELGKELSKILQKGDVICLYGNLGSGKTTFTQGLADGLGIKNRIISPTFVIARCYEIKKHELEILNFYHIDLYRIECEKDIENLGIVEILENINNIVVIEWAEKLKKYLPKKRIDIEFSYEKNDSRKIVIRSSNQ